MTSSSSLHGDVVPSHALLNTLLAYSKNYEGAVPHRKLDSVKFADEQEWRHVPAPGDLEAIKAPPFITSKVESAAKAQHDKAVRGLDLKFEPSDIRYILVKESAEIGDVADKISNIFRKGLDSEALDILRSRILTTEQIKEDF